LHLDRRCSIYALLNIFCGPDSRHFLIWLASTWKGAWAFLIYYFSALALSTTEWVYNVETSWPFGYTLIYWPSVGKFGTSKVIIKK